MSDVFAQSFGVPNYSGMLYRKGNEQTPFLSMIAGNGIKYTDHVQFAMGVEYEAATGEQPAISETASLTAPDATVVTRSQKTNVAQIYQYAFGISDAKMSNMGTLSGINVAGQVANPANELDFQAARKMAKAGQDIEYTLMNGVYNLATTDAEINKTRGMFPAITSAVLDADGKELGYWLVAEAMKLVEEAGGDASSLVLWLDGISRMQLNKDCQLNGLTIIPAAREINGINVSVLTTPMGDIYLHTGKYIPAGTVGLFNLSACHPVELNVPNKGNFYLEELAKQGAGSKYQIFGQEGLDYGCEWLHGKITGLKTTFEAPESGVKIYGGPVATIDVDANLTGATLDKTTVDPSDSNKVAVESLAYDVKPGTDPTLAYLWQIRAKSGTVWTDLTSAYTGYNTSELTIKAADAEKHYRCKVTASGSATGTVYSNECTVNAAS